MKIPNKKYNIKTAVKNNFYMLKLAMELCPGRVLCSGLVCLSGYFSWLFFSGFFLKKLVSMLEENRSYPEILGFLAGTIGLFFFLSLFENWYEERLKPLADVDVYQGLYRRLYEKVCNMELACFEDSEFYNRYLLAMEDTDKRLLQVVDNIWQIVFGTAAVAVSWVMLFSLDKWAILFVLGPVIGNFVFAAALNRISYRMYEESAIFKRIADYVNRVVHLSDYAKEIRLTGIFHVMQKKHRESVEGMTKIIDKYALRSILNGWGYLYCTFTIMFEGVIFYGAYRTMVAGTMKLSEYSVLSSLMVAVSWILIGYSNSLTDSFKQGMYIANLRAFMEYEPGMPEDSDGVPAPERVERIEFQNVSFSYRTGGPVLKRVSFTIQAGITCAIAGYNGAGKTTLIKLLLRLYDPTEGRILVNGRDIREYNLRSYRRLFATAFQDGKILARSVRDNVSMGEKIPEERIWQALKLAGTDKTIEALTCGLDTVLTKEFTEDGAVLSGGQAQKIIAARAFVQDSPVMVFDEPSSALDPIAEYELFQSISRAKQDKLLVFISHRLSSVQNADQILLLGGGHLMEEGSHLELMRRNGEYAALYRMQARNYQAVWEEEDWAGGSIFTEHLSGGKEAAGGGR